MNYLCKETDCSLSYKTCMNINNNFILDILPFGLTIINSNKKICYINKHMEKFINLDTKNILCANLNSISINNNEFKIYKKIVELTFKKGYNIPIQYFKNSDGNIYSISAQIINYKTREILVIINNCNNIEKHLLKVIEGEKTFMKGQIVGEVFHELKNIISTIQVNTQILKSHLYLEDNNNIKYVNNILAQLNYINELSRDFLDLSHNKTPQPSLITIIQIIEEVKLLFVEELAQNKIKLETFYDYNLQHIYIDSNQLKQVLINLISNAIDALGYRGTIKISSHYLNQKFFTIELNDNGPGIDENFLPNIFQPFFTTKDKGTGLGLAISKRIMKNLQGSIKVTSNKGKGTTFTLILPFKYQENNIL
jgi:signal transduction histidine kinase